MCSRARWGFPSLPDILAEIDLIGALNTHIAVAQQSQRYAYIPRSAQGIIARS